jgi:hypothetical protein
MPLSADTARRRFAAGAVLSSASAALRFLLLSSCVCSARGVRADWLFMLKTCTCTKDTFKLGCFFARESLHLLHCHPQLSKQAEQRG